MSRLLIFGGGSQVARELLALAAERGVDAKGLPRAQCNIIEPTDVAAAIDAYRPDLAVNCAAYTAVDKAESEEAAAMAVNATGPQIIGRETCARGIPLLHISTDYVFDGSKVEPYVETDPIKPLGVYGRSKLAGEDAVRRSNLKHFILRTAWVYGVYGNNFLKVMLRLACEHKELRVVNDQRGCPTSTRDIAEAVLAVLASLERGETHWGLYHFCGEDIATWHDFACQIVAEQQPYTGRIPPVHAITTADYPTSARRPANSALNSQLFAETFGYRGADWRVRTRETVAMLCRKSGDLA